MQVELIFVCLILLGNDENLIFEDNNGKLFCIHTCILYTVNFWFYLIKNRMNGYAQLSVSL